MRRRTARRAYTRRRRNPAKFDFGRIARDTGNLLAVLAPLVMASNWLANMAYKKDDAGNTTQTVSQWIGPWFPVGFDLAALFGLRFLKGGLGRYRSKAKDVLQVLLALDVMQLVAYTARRGWSLDESKLLVGNEYPEWTDLLALRAPEPAVRLQGHAYAHPQLRGAPVGQSIPDMNLIYDTSTGAWRHPSELARVSA